MIMPSSDLVGPSLPPHQSPGQQQQQAAQVNPVASRTAPAALVTEGSAHQHPSHLGDSLIDMIINLRNDNQNLVRALEANNEYVKERLSEFKRCQEESKRREAQFAMDKAEYEHQIRKLKRQNDVLSERLKSMEAKLKDMKLEVSESLQAANSSKASSVRNQTAEMYPNLDDENLDTTMQVDATSGELYNEGDRQSTKSSEPSAPIMSDSMAAAGTSQQQAAMESDDNDQSSEDEDETGSDNEVARQVSQMSKEELSKRFDANKAEFYAIKDPLKQCDKLEQQLNDIGKRDYEICLLQQQLNIYRQDFRLERMANLEAKLQIEKLKNDIDRLCLERLQEKAASQPQQQQTAPKYSTAADAVSKFGIHLSKKAAKSAAKAARYAAKQAHREERARAATAAAASAAAAATARGSAAAGTSGAATGEAEQHHSHRHHHHSRRHHHHLPGQGHRAPRGMRSEVVNDLLSTANKAVMTGYRMASTHVNLALDKLSQFEQAQANQLAQQQAAGNAVSGDTRKKVPSAPQNDMPSVD